MFSGVRESKLYLACVHGDVEKRVCLNEGPWTGKSAEDLLFSPSVQSQRGYKAKNKTRCRDLFPSSFIAWPDATLRCLWQFARNCMTLDWLYNYNGKCVEQHLMFVNVFLPQATLV